MGTQWTSRIYWKVASNLDVLVIQPEVLNTFIMECYLTITKNRVDFYRSMYNKLQDIM